MERRNAVPAAQGYSRIFWLEFKTAIAYRDFIMALGAAIVTPVVGRFLFNVKDWKVAVASAVIGAFIVFAIDCAWKAQRILWSSYARLQKHSTQLGLDKTEIEIIRVESETRKRERLEQVIDEGNFLYGWRSEKNSPMWAHGFQRWNLSAIKSLADYLGECLAVAKKRVEDYTAFDGTEAPDFLKRQIENLSKSLPRSVSQS